MRILMAGLTLVASAASAVGAEKPPVIKCPDVLEVREEVSGQTDGWESLKDEGKGQHVLDNIFIYENHPREMASLVPDSQKEKGEKLSSKWKLVDNGKTDYWVGCSYRSTKMMLVKKLSPTLKECIVQHDVIGKGSVLSVAGIECR